MAVTMLTMEDAEHFTQQQDLMRGELAQLRLDFDELASSQIRSGKGSKESVDETK